jgi:hypothetical protein
MCSEIQKKKLFLTKIAVASPSQPKIKALKWSQEEDTMLISLVEQYGLKNWKLIAEKMETRTSIQCLHRWSKILQPGLVKGPWSVSEDKKLMEWVKKNGAMKWSICSEHIPGRSGKQCRERWYNNLNPNLVKGNWTPKEDYLIFKLYMEIGSKWSNIAEQFKGRTENSIKNRFYSTLRRIASRFNSKDAKIILSNNNNNKQKENSNSLNGLSKYISIALKEKHEQYLKSKQFRKEYLRSITKKEGDIQQKNKLKPDIENKQQSETAMTSDISVPSSPSSSNNNDNQLKENNEFIISEFQETINSLINNNNLTLLYNYCQSLIAKENLLSMFINNSLCMQNIYYNLINTFLSENSNC